MISSAALGASPNYRPLTGASIISGEYQWHCRGPTALPSSTAGSDVRNIFFQPLPSIHFSSVPPKPRNPLWIKRRCVPPFSAGSSDHVTVVTRYFGSPCHVYVSRRGG